MQPRSESLYNPSQSRWFRTKPKQCNSDRCSLFPYIYLYLTSSISNSMNNKAGEYSKTFNSLDHPGH